MPIRSCVTAAGLASGTYLFHLVRDHPFADGNKRTGLMAMLTFLGLNGLRLRADADELTGVVVGVAAGKITKAEIAVFLKSRTRRRG
ncbi:MAG: type II toxin-antitoxin system death-on-curing family toxin [Candidatus Rokuibacteriota bacterium]